MAKYLVLGALTRDFILPPRGKALVDVPGGGAAYAAAGAALWGGEPMLVARVGEDYPRHWLKEFATHGWDLSGVRILPQALDVRRVLVYDQRGRLLPQAPASAFAQRGVPFPQALLGYAPPPPPTRTSLETPTERSLRLSDLPPLAIEAHAAHLCPYDFVTHNLMPAALRQIGVTTVSLEPSADYFKPLFSRQVETMLTGLSAVIVPERVLRDFYARLTSNLWEMAEAVAKNQVKTVVIRRANGEVWVYARAGARWVIPPYPVEMSDPTGASDAFAGGFMVGYSETLDPLAAAARAAVAYSLAIETKGVFALLEVLPALVQRRLESVLSSAQKL